MGPAATAARLVLGATLLVAAVGKLRDPGWPGAARGFGVPGPVARAVPVTEAVVGLALALQLRIGAYAAFALLVAFSVLVVGHLVRGSRPPCGCFGIASERPIGAGTLVRNGMLLAVALVAATGR